MEEIKFEENTNILSIRKERKKMLILFAILFLSSSFFLFFNIQLSPLYLLYPAIFAFYVIAIRISYFRFIKTPLTILLFPLITFFVSGFIVWGILSQMNAWNMGMEGIFFIPGIYAFFFGGLIFSIVYSVILYKEKIKGKLAQKN